MTTTTKKRKAVADNFTDILGDLGASNGNGAAKGQVTRPKRAHKTETGIKQFKILSIRPDPDQPRSLLPNNLFVRLNDGDDPYDILAAWLKVGEEDESVQATLDKIQELADSIRSIGLIQPILISRKDRQLIVITGERRWWAHLLLSSQGKIPNGGKKDTVGAIQRTIKDSDKLFIQVVENLHRQNLTAIEMAWGLQLLFDTTTHLTKSAEKWAYVGKELGVPPAYRRKYIALLKLQPSIQDEAQKNGWAEGALRPLVKLSDYPDLQEQAADALRDWKKEDTYSVARMNSYIEALLAAKTGEGDGSNDDAVPPPTFNPNQFAGIVAKKMGGLFKLSNQFVEMSAADKAALTDVLGQDDQAKEAWQTLRQQMDNVFDGV